MIKIFEGDKTNIYDMTKKYEADYCTFGYCSFLSLV